MFPKLIKNNTVSFLVSCNQLTIGTNGLLAAASAGFTCLMFSFPLSFLGLMNAYIRKPPALLAAGLLGVVNIYIIL